MSITVIGMRMDGALLGEDADGVLHVGTKKFIGHDALTRTVVDGVATYTYNGEVVAKGTVGEQTHPDLAADGEAAGQKQYQQVIVIQANGDEAAEAREVKMEVVDWSPL